VTVNGSSYDVVIIGSGAGGGTVAQGLVPLVEAGGFLTADGTMTLAFAQVYGGSTAVYTGTSLTAPERVIRQWDVPCPGSGSPTPRCFRMPWRSILT